MSEDDPLRARARARIGMLLDGKWRIESLLGMGGMAAVYAATHRNQNRVAIKILHAELALRPDLSERFAREGYAANTVGHPGVVKVLDDGVLPDGAPFLVMELLEGENLEARARRRSEVMSPSETVAVAEQLLDVLVAAHRAGVVHRDLKPDNLFLTTEGRLKVLDFGVARLVEGSKEGSHGTRAGSVLGTPPFMAPEQALGRWNEVDERTDLWGVGATLFTLASGWLVHDADTPNEQLVRAATERAVSLRQRAPEVPEELAAIVDRALQYDKAARWQSAAEMLAVVRELAPRIGPDSMPRLPKAPLAVSSDAATIAADLTAPGQSVTAAGPATAATRASPRARRRILAGAVVVAFVTCAVGAVTLWRSTEIAVQPLAPSVPGRLEPTREPARPTVAPVPISTPAPAPAASGDAGAGAQPPPKRPSRPIRRVPTTGNEDELYDRRR